MGIRAHNNNRAQTVLDLFLATVISDYGVPSRVRGDHGVENVLVAEWMFQKRGPGKKPYIWGPYAVLFFLDLLVTKPEFASSFAGARTILVARGFGTICLKG